MPMKIIERILEMTADGVPLNKILREVKLTSYRFNKLLDDTPGFREAYLKCHEYSYEILAERVRLVAMGEDGYSSGDLARDRLIIDTDMKLLSKWTPKYADRITSDVNVNMQITTEQRQAAILAFQATIAPPANQAIDHHHTIDHTQAITTKAIPHNAITTQAITDDADQTHHQTIDHPIYTDSDSYSQPPDNEPHHTPDQSSSTDTDPVLIPRPVARNVDLTRTIVNANPDVSMDDILNISKMVKRHYAAVKAEGSR